MSTLETENLSGIKRLQKQIKQPTILSILQHKHNKKCKKANLLNLRAPSQRRNPIGASTIGMPDLLVIAAPSSYRQK